MPISENDFECGRLRKCSQKVYSTLGHETVPFSNYTEMTQMRFCTWETWWCQNYSKHLSLWDYQTTAITLKHTLITHLQTAVTWLPDYTPTHSWLSKLAVKVWTLLQVI